MALSGGYDLPSSGEHERFIASCIWRTACAGQVGFAVERVVELSSDDAWAPAVERWAEQHHTDRDVSDRDGRRGDGPSGGAGDG